MEIKFVFVLEHCWFFEFLFYIILKLFFYPSFPSVHTCSMWFNWLHNLAMFHMFKSN